VKVALVHELLTQKGGAERVLRVLAAMYPDAPIYTLLYDEKKLGDWFPRTRIRTSALQKFARFSSNHHYYLSWFPNAVEAWNFDPCSSHHPPPSLKLRRTGNPLPFEGEREECFDLVISSSSAFAHGIITNGKPKHLCYVHSPARYLWDRTHDVLTQSSKGLLGPLKRWYLSHLFHTLRIWDAESADRPDALLAASKTVQRRIELYWRRESAVIYPPIDDHWFSVSHRSHVLGPRSYFLIVSTLAPYKRIDIAIEAYNHLRLPLTITGSGPDRKRLERLAGPTVTFLGYVPEENLPDLYRGAIATICPGDEDFGLVPLESMACGTPVIAFRSGGALETIQENITGQFFNEPTAPSLAEAIQYFDRSHFSEDTCRAHAQKFSREAFEKDIRSAVAKLLIVS